MPCQSPVFFYQRVGAILLLEAAHHARARRQRSSTMTMGLPVAYDPTALLAAGAGGPTARENVLRAPLVPFALAITAGIVLDRYAAIPLPISLLAAVTG